MKELTLQLASDQPLNTLFLLDATLYYGKAIYYEDIVRASIVEHAKAESKANVDSIKFREMKWQFFALFNKLESLLEQRSLYDIELYTWFEFKRFFVREKYSPVLQPYLFSSIKKNLEKLVCFLELNNFDSNKTQASVKKIIESDYTFYRSYWLSRHSFTNEKEKFSYIVNYIKGIDKMIALSVASIYAKGFYLEREFSFPKMADLTSNSASSAKRRIAPQQPYTRKTCANLTAPFFKRLRPETLNANKKTIKHSSASKAVNAENLSMTQVNRGGDWELRTHEQLERVYQVITDAIIQLEEYNHRIKRPANARGESEQKNIDHLRAQLLPQVNRFFIVKSYFEEALLRSESSNEVPLSSFFKSKLDILLTEFQKLKNIVETIQKKESSFLSETMLHAPELVAR